MEERRGHCVHCGAVVLLPRLGPPPRDELCQRCHANIHSCQQCRWFDPRAAQQCREPQAEYVGDKASANFCNFFEFQGRLHGVDPQAAATSSAKAALDALFRKG